MSLIRARNLSKKYGDFTAVKGIDFSVEEGEVFGFLGPNGAGKTTTINMLIGLSRVTEGEFYIDGVDGRENIKKVQNRIGVVSDTSNLYDELTGTENLAFCAALYGIPKEEGRRRARKLLQQFGLQKAMDKPFKTYSRGMQRKATIAAGIIHEPRLLFLDEPTTGLDVVSARQIRALIRELYANGTTIFLTTHYIEEAERLCSRVAFIVDGEIPHIDTVERLLEQAREEHILEFTPSGELSLEEDYLQEIFPGSRVRVNHNRLQIIVREAGSVKPFVDQLEAEGLSIVEARVIRPTLEDVLMRITGIETEGLKEGSEA